MMKSKRNRRLSLKTQESITAGIFVAPYVGGFILFTMIPIFIAFYMSLLNFNQFGDFADIFNGKIDFVFFQNYIKFFNDPIATESFIKSFYFAIIYVPLVMVISLFLALLLNKAFAFKTLSRSLIFLPYVTNIVAVAMIFTLLLDTQGIVNSLLSTLGVQNPPGWLMDPDYSLPTTALVNVWHQIPYVSIIYLAALQDVPSELYEASQVDGANKFSQLINVTLPSISPATFFIFITSLASSFKNYALVKTLTNGGPGISSRVAVLNIYEEAFNYYHYSYAAAQAVLLFLVILTITLIQWKGQKKWVHY